MIVDPPPPKKKLAVVVSSSLGKGAMEPTRVNLDRVLSYFNMGTRR